MGRKLTMKQFTIRRLMLLTMLVGVLCTFDWDYRPPYYECRGIVSMSHPALKIGCFATWSGPGFRDKYGPEIGVKYGEGHVAYIYWDYYYGTRPFTFRFYNF